MPAALKDILRFGDPTLWKSAPAFDRVGVQCAFRTPRGPTHAPMLAPWLGEVVGASLTIAQAQEPPLQTLELMLRVPTVPAAHRQKQPKTPVSGEQQPQRTSSGVEMQCVHK